MKIINKLFFFSLIVSALFLSSCKVLFPNRMFQKGNYEYFSVGQQTLDQYTIVRGDLLTLRIFSREGFDLIDVLPNETGGGSSGLALGGAGGGGAGGGGGGAGGGGGGQNVINYLVEQDGYVELPLFGRTMVLGMTENELEDLIEEKCRSIFIEPFAILQVTNRRAFVFKGDDADVISLNQGPTTLLEVIAKSGGIGINLKAYNIKILRGDLKNPEIIEVDLSTIQGLQNADLIVQSNDIIYIEQRFRFLNSALKEATPIVSILGTTTTIIVLVTRF
jgi:polysaccharide export outer membrane protein